MKAEIRELNAGLRGDKARCADVVDGDIVANTLVTLLCWAHPTALLVLLLDALTNTLRGVR